VRVAVNSFRGEAPRVTPRALPDNAAQSAVNARLLTGDLEAWRQFELEKTLANSPGPVETIYKLKDAWLSWLADVNAARGAVAGDTTYRTFLTGPNAYDRPQFTNYAMAISGPEPYPADTRPLGVPGPEVAPTVVAGIDPNPSTFNVDIFDEGNELATNWTAASSQFSHGGATEVQQNNVFGNPAPSYETLFDDNPGAPAYIYRNFGVGKCNVVRMSFDFYMTSGSNNYYQMNAGVMRTQTGNGLVVTLYQVSPGVGQFNLGAAVGWTIIGNSALGSSVLVAVGHDAWYTCEIQMLANSDGTQTVTATLYQGSVQLATLTTTNTFANGDYCGFYSETSNNDGSDRYRTFYDNILVQGSGATGYVAANTATNYVFTYVNDLGQESAPSFASTTVLRPDGIAITVTTPTTLPSGFDDYGIATKRIYRAVSGATGTSYQFVAETPLSQADYVDSIPDTELGEVLQSELWALPPTDLQGLVALPNGVLAGFSKNQLCLSAQNYPHAWPVEYRLNVDTDIVAIGVIDTTVVIGTQNFIYLAIGTDPAAYSMTKLEVPQACVSKRSLAYLIGIGVVFASPDGLIAVAGNGNVRNLTSAIFTREQWQALAPETILGVAHEDIYFFWYDQGPSSARGGFALDMKADGFGLIELGFFATAAFADPLTDQLYLVLTEDDEPTDVYLPLPSTAPTNTNGLNIFKFNAPNGDGRMVYRWRGKLNLLAHPAAFVYCQVRAEDFDNIVLRLYANGVLLSEDVITSETPFTLPLADDYTTFQLELLGTSRVYTVQVAEDISEFD
jgi:hypothetical protein